MGVAGLLLVVGLAACEQPSEPSLASVALVPRVSLDPGSVPPREVRYRVSMLSSPRSYDTLIVARPTDTLFLADLDPATYRVDVEGWPPRCSIDSGESQTFVVFERGLTTLVRWRVRCSTSLTVLTSFTGDGPADTLLYRFVAPDGAVTERRGLATDTIAVDGLAPGTWRVGLGLLPPDCFPLSPGGASTVPIDVSERGGARLILRIACPPPSVVPRLLDLAASFHDGVIGGYLRATDPNRDLDRYAFDLTDCAGRSLQQNGERVRFGLLPAFGPGPDTAEVTFGVHIGEVAVEELATRCLSVRVIDRGGNSTPPFQVRLRPRDASRAPRATFDARFTTVNRADLSASVADPDGDFAGVFVFLFLRDGTTNGVFDGRPDVGLLNAVGYPDPQRLPWIPLGNGKPPFDAYLEIGLLAIDRAGNATFVRDGQLLP